MRPGYLSVRPPVGPSVLSAQQPQGHLVPPIFATPVVRFGAWNDDIGLRRYAEPPMVNPIEPGVAADPERPGTGVDLNPMKPASYDQRWDQKLYDQLRQDVLITAEGGHVPTGHGSGWALYGRCIVVRGIERTAAASPGISKITFYPSPLNGRVHVEGMVFDQTLGGSDDMFMIQQGPHLWDTNVTDWNNYLPGSLIITPSLRLYVILARGVGPSAEPVDETGNSFTSGTATIAFVKKFADKAAFEAEFPRQDHTFQRIYAKGRHGCYYSYYAGASNTTGEEYVKASVPVTKVVRDATGLVTLTTAAAHNVVAGTHPLINVCHVPYEAVNGVAKRTVGGLWVPTIVDATTITYQTTVTGTPMTWTAPAAEPYYLQPFTRLGSGSATVAGKTITITTNAPHLLPALGANGLQWVCVWGAGLPLLMEGDLLVISAASGSTITATIPNAYSLPDGTYPNLAVLGHGLFPSSAGKVFSAHADFAQVEVSSRVGTIRAYQVTDTHFSYDAYLFGTRFPLETMVKGAEFARCNWRRRQEHIPYDPGNATFIANEADEANFNVRLFEVALAQQGPRGLTDVAFGRECTVELDRNETGNNVCNPSPGRHINGLDAGALFRSEFGQRYVYYPPVAHIAGRLYLTPCQEGDTRPRDVLQRSQVGTGYVRGALADAPTLVAPPAPTFKLLAAAFSENTLADVDLGWVDVVPDPSALLDLGRGLFAWRGNSHGLRQHRRRDDRRHEGRAGRDVGRADQARPGTARLRLGGRHRRRAAGPRVLAGREEPERPHVAGDRATGDPGHGGGVAPAEFGGHARPGGEQRLEHPGGDQHPRHDGGLDQHEPDHQGDGGGCRRAQGVLRDAGARRLRRDGTGASRPHCCRHRPQRHPGDDGGHRGHPVQRHGVDQRLDELDAQRCVGDDPGGSELARDRECPALRLRRRPQAVVDRPQRRLGVGPGRHRGRARSRADDRRQPGDRARRLGPVGHRHGSPAERRAARPGRRLPLRLRWRRMGLPAAGGLHRPVTITPRGPWAAG
ncbi:hypothetical protein [uncultured Methylobacterium sp.]|jgi:hypothetical protein|uniref:hypothetical protein n=1 Tax=uncultured Methylobacterium sp. TaxID=157278 RepID=UPI002615ADBE|nr:hypothetical protein [uncultured Methylobacterium sp.]